MWYIANVWSALVMTSNISYKLIATNPMSVCDEEY